MQNKRRHNISQIIYKKSENTIQNMAKKNENKNVENQGYSNGNVKILYKGL